MKHFLHLSDLTSAELYGLLDKAVALKNEWQGGGNRPILKNKALAMVFQKPSLRTRVSFEMGMVHLGGYALYLAPDEVKMGTRETPADVARVLSGYVQGVMARVLDHRDILELAEYSSVPVINGLSDYNHPAQGLTDLLTIYEKFGRLEGIGITYVGDGNNVARSLLFGAMLTGAHFRIATPPGYTLNEEDFEVAESIKSRGATFESFYSAPQAVEGAEVIYTDVWTSMGQVKSPERSAAFKDFQVDQSLVQQAHPNCIVMHCLPAIRGEEISGEVADGPRSVIFQQAENRMHAQKAILAELLAD